MPAATVTAKNILALHLREKEQKRAKGVYSCKYSLRNVVLPGSSVRQKFAVQNSGLKCTPFRKRQLNFDQYAAIAGKRCEIEHKFVHRVSKNCAKLFLSKLRQIFTNFDDICQKDGKKARIMRDALNFHLT